MQVHSEDPTHLHHLPLRSVTVQEGTRTGIQADCDLVVRQKLAPEEEFNLINEVLIFAKNSHELMSVNQSHLTCKNCSKADLTSSVYASSSSLFDFSTIVDIEGKADVSFKKAHTFKK